MNQSKYCPDCGSLLEIRIQEERERDYCTQCQRFHYQQLKVGAGALIEQDGKLLLLKRTRPPFLDCWNIPAGYTEADEDPYQTVVREVHEEVGLKVEVVQLVDSYFFDDDPRGNGVLLVFKCRIIGGEHRSSDEVSEYRYFSKGDLPAQLAGGGHNQAINTWKS